MLQCTHIHPNVTQQIYIEIVNAMMLVGNVQCSITMAGEILSKIVSQSFMMFDVLGQRCQHSANNYSN